MSEDKGNKYCDVWKFQMSALWQAQTKHVRRRLPEVNFGTRVHVSVLNGILTTTWRHYQVLYPLVSSSVIARVFHLMFCWQLIKNYTQVLWKIWLVLAFLRTKFKEWVQLSCTIKTRIIRGESIIVYLSALISSVSSVSCCISWIQDGRVREHLPRG